MMLCLGLLISHVPVAESIRLPWRSLVKEKAHTKRVFQQSNAFKLLTNLASITKLQFCVLFSSRCVGSGQARNMSEDSREEREE